MVKKKILLLLLLLPMLPGCGSIQSDPKAHLLTSDRIFTSTCKALLELRLEDKISDADWDKVLILAAAGDKILDDWRDAILDGKKYPYAAEEMKAIIEELLGIKEKEGS